MNTPFLKKYQPQKYPDFIIDPDYIKLLKTMINMNNLNILLIGNNGSGKTSLIEATIREYYNLEQIPKHNVLIINNLKDQGIQYYRNEVKIFSILKLFKPKFLYIINSFFSKILIKKN